MLPSWDVTNKKYFIPVIQLQGVFFLFFFSFNANPMLQECVSPFVAYSKFLIFEMFFTQLNKYVLFVFIDLNYIIFCSS